MIIVEGWVKLAEGELDKLHDAATTMMAETRKEEGCLLYVFTREIENPDTMRISERWASQEAIDAHGKSAHMAEFNKAIGGASILGAHIQAFPAEAGRTIMGGE
ncbi:MAG: antibiotic biosynthesis monooxygenase [Sphingomonadaceae bacterium]|nr:antibiotic biosynthesis monooxygenase [Sphingomonadaceae bacterium]